MPHILRKLLERGKVNLPVPRRKMVVVEIHDIVEMHPRKKCPRIFAKLGNLHLAAPTMHLAHTVVPRVKPAANRRALELAYNLGKFPFRRKSLVLRKILKGKRHALLDKPRR